MYDQTYNSLHRMIPSSKGTLMIHALTKRETDALIDRHIGPHPANPGIDEYWLKEPGVSVWAIIGSLGANDGDTGAVARLYHLSREEMDAALQFYARHRAVIDNRLLQNDID
jgi:hypothetical protein